MCFEIWEGISSGKFLEVGLLSQKVSTYIIWLNSAKFPSQELKQFTFAPTVYESACFSTATLSKSAIVFHFCHSDR